MSEGDRDNVVTDRRSRAGSHYQPAPIAAVVILLLFAVSVFAVLHYVSTVPVGGGSSNPGVTTTTKASNSPSTTVPRSRVKVQVANGTSISHLASYYTGTLQLQAWYVLVPINGPQVAATVVYYQPGFKWAAVQIANTIRAPVTAVQPLNGAKPVAGAAGDNIIVIIGPNLVRG